MRVTDTTYTTNLYLSSTTASQAIVTDANKKLVSKSLSVSKPTAATNKWVSAIGQDATGQISVDYSTLVTTGTWSGNAETATKWASAQTTYVALGTASKTTSIQGGSSSAVALGIDGTLAVEHGGTGTTSFTANSVIMSGNSDTAALTTRAVFNMTNKGHLSWTAAATDIHLVTKNTLAYWDGRFKDGKSNLTYCVKGAFGDAVTYAVDDATTNGALGTGTGLTTERSVYYGLVTVNNASQTRATGIYAPTSAGTANQILVSSGGTSAPVWKATANGAAYATSANGALTFGTLPIAQGGTGATSAGAAYSNIKNGNFLSCSTAANDAAKTVNYTGFALKTGVTISIKFTTQNTATTPTLNVGGSGAKNIYCRGVQVKSYGLLQNYVYNMVYDGTQWQILNPPTGLYAICETAIGETAKTVNVPGFVAYPGAEVWISFEAGSSAASPTLNINSLGAKYIYNFGGYKRATWYAFNAGQYYCFIYNGSNFYTAADVTRHEMILGVTKVTDSTTGEVTTAEVHGFDYFYLGNNLKSTTTNGMTGALRLYGAGTSYLNISASKQITNYNVSWYFPEMTSSRGGSARYFVSNNNQSALGSEVQPIHLTSYGRTAVCDNIINLIYPVGSIYISTNAQNPGGGADAIFPNTTWEPFGQGKVLVGVDSTDTDFNTGGKEGGEKTHLLTETEMPNHRHIPYGNSTSDVGGLWRYTTIKAINATPGVGGPNNGSGKLEMNSVPNSQDSYPRVGFASTYTGTDKWDYTALNEATGWTGGREVTNSDGTITVVQDEHNNMQPYITVYMWKRIANP